MNNKEYFLKELELTDNQKKLIFDKVSQHKLKIIERDFVPMIHQFSIEYQFTTIGVAKILKVGDEEIIINEDDLNNL